MSIPPGPAAASFAQVARASTAGGSAVTYSKSAVRERYRHSEARLALAQRRVELEQRRRAALRKIIEGHEELERVNRLLEALDRGEELPEEAFTAGAPATAPLGTIGQRAKRILTEHPGVRHSPRGVAAKMRELGWVDGIDDALVQRLRHSLRRLADHDAEVDRDESGMTKFYWYAPGRH